MRTKLTDRNVNRKPPAKGQLEMWDTVLPGFGLRISYGGKRAYFIMARINGKQRRLSVGNAALIGLAEAREKARDMMRDAARGIDPNERERIERREAHKARQDTFAAMAELYMTEHGSKRKSGGEMQRKLDVDILPEIGHLPIADITRADIKGLILKKAATSPVSANRLLALIRPIFIYAQDEERLDTVPNFRGLKQSETPRDRVLSDDEIRDVWRGAVRLGGPYGRLVRFALLTAQRRGEVAGLVRDELNGDGWKLPSERSKNGIGHLVPVAPLAQSILDDCPLDNSGLMFAGASRGERKEPGELSAWSLFKNQLDRAVMNIRREDAEKAGADPDEVRPLPRWTVHDLRRTAATGLQSLGVTDELVDRVLNHVQTGVRKAYNHYARDEQKRHALEAWARHVAAVVSGEPAPSNVVELREGV